MANNITSVAESIEIRDDKKVYAIVVYTSSVDPSFVRKEEYVIDPPTPAVLFAKIAERELVMFTQFVDPAALKALLSLAKTDVTQPLPTPADPPQPDPERDAWLALVGIWNRSQALSPTHTFRVDLQTQIDNGFDPRFVGAAK